VATHAANVLTHVPVVGIVAVTEWKSQFRQRLQQAMKWINRNFAVESGLCGLLSGWSGKKSVQKVQ
jgi:hypothetical protein